MSICPTFSHLAKGREESLAHTLSLKQLESSKAYTYKLHHLYDSEPCDIYVKTNIEPSVFELLLAHILFEASEIEQTYALGQEEIAQPVLKELYGVEVLEETAQYSEAFDLYYVWEKWCGKYDAVRNLDVLKNKELNEVLSKIVPVIE